MAGCWLISISRYGRKERLVNWHLTLIWIKEEIEIRLVTVFTMHSKTHLSFFLLFGSWPVFYNIHFSQSGKEAIREWKPHLIYVQGGNTFWLHHCMEKGDWTKDLTDACCCYSDDASSFSAVYCGVSAGAILAGQSMQTACWKVC